jgi:hypothetical protein
MYKSLNQLYKESGTTLTYKEWRRREDEKLLSFNDDYASFSIDDSKLYQKTKDEMSKLGGYKEGTSNKTIFGINQTVVLISLFILSTAIIYKVVKNKK